MVEEKMWQATNVNSHQRCTRAICGIDVESSTPVGRVVAPQQCAQVCRLHGRQAAASPHRDGARWCWASVQSASSCRGAPGKHQAPTEGPLWLPASHPHCAAGPFRRHVAPISAWPVAASSPSTMLLEWARPRSRLDTPLGPDTRFQPRTTGRDGCRALP